tara:strand:+ start:49 stop:651 length:603 start_codon:yes stop_codon:yes gene_type:complete
MGKPEKNKNWQIRQYDNYGPHFRIDTGNPEVGADGATVWGMYGEDPDTKAKCSLRQSSTGFFHLYNDGNIEIIGGMGPEGSAANKEGNTVDLLLRAGSDGGQISLKVKEDGTIAISGGKKITLDAKDIEINAGNNVDISAGNKIEFNSTTLTYTEKCIWGKIPPNLGEMITAGTFVTAMGFGGLQAKYGAMLAKKATSLF